MTHAEASIILQGFEIDASIGIHDFEKAARQRLIIDIELHLAAATRPDNDHIEHVLDYDFLRHTAKGLLSARHYELQETLAHDIADACLAHPAVSAVTIQTRKPDVYPDCRSIGYRLHIRR